MWSSFDAKQLGITRDHAVFAGDSGNDLPVLTSAIKSVLVANASAEVREEANNWRACIRPKMPCIWPKRFYGMNGITAPVSWKVLLIICRRLNNG